MTELALAVDADDELWTLDNLPTSAAPYVEVGSELVEIRSRFPSQTYTLTGQELPPRIRVRRGIAGTTKASHVQGSTLTPNYGLGSGVGGEGAGVLEDPGNVWEPDTAVTEGYRIAETWQAELRVFEAVGAGTTANDASVFPDDYPPVLTPLGVTSEAVDWRYLGIVGHLPWDVVPLLPGIEATNDAGVRIVDIASNKLFGDSARIMRLLAALADPGNVWEAAFEVVEPNYRIMETVDGQPRVFEAVGAGTSGGTIPAFNVAALLDQTVDGTVTWAYHGILGEPDTAWPIFDAKTDGDADWWLDLNAGAGFRFNISIDGVGVVGAGTTQMTTEGFSVQTAVGGFHVIYDPFSIQMGGLPTADPGEGFPDRLWIDVAAGRVLKVSAG